MTPEIKSFKFDDTCQRVYFYMNNKGNFIILDENENIIQDFFPPRMNMSKKCINIYNEYKRCNDFIDLEGKSLFFFQKKNEGFGHSISLLTNFLAMPGHPRLLIPESTHPNIINLIDNIFDFTLLEKCKIYKIKKLFLSTFLHLLHPLTGTGCKFVTPHGRYPLVYYNRNIWWFKTMINNYVDFKMKQKPAAYDKIFVGKFEGQGMQNNKIQAPRSDYGFIDKKLLDRFERNGFVNIDPYNYHIHDVIWYIRHCKELIISTGTAAIVYLPYLSKKTMVYYMTNIPGENGLIVEKNSHLLKNNSEYNKKSDTVLKFMNNYRICFYKSDAKWRCNSEHSPLYKGEDMLDFLKIQ